MRKRMQELAEGKFEYEGPQLVFSQEQIEITVLEGEDYSGSFTVSSSNQVAMRGIVYATNSRISLGMRQFEDVSVTVPYEFHSDGLEEGDIQEGDFYFICNQGEYSLSFSASVSKYYETASLGVISNFDKFIQLSRESYESGYHIFTAPYFANLFPKLSEGAELSRGFSYKQASRVNMEEFLIFMKAKEKVLISTDCSMITMEEINFEESFHFDITKDNWGYLELSVTSDAGFIQVEREKATTEDFVGNTYRCEIVIREKALHAGKNWGKITIESSCQVLSIPVCASRISVREKNAGHREGKEAALKLWQYYVDYRLKKMTPGIWAAQSLMLLEHMIGFSQENEIYWLFKAQILFLSGRKQEAEWILKEYKKKTRDKYSDVWGYYLYLTTLFIKERNYVRKVTRKIEEIYLRNDGDLLLFCALLFLEEDYEHNRNRKMKVIEEQVNLGKNSPALYVEAWHLISNDPYLLHKLERFECNLLLWAKKRGVLTEEVALRTASLQCNRKKYDKRIHEVLEDCYSQWPKKEILFAICSNLLRGSCYRKLAHPWYLKGIENQLHLTNLYEAFLLSATAEEKEAYPKEVLLYFQYKNNLPAKHKAALYGKLIRSKEEYITGYLKCKKDMEIFARQQMAAKNMDENLAVLYEDIWKQENLNHESARLLAPVLFLHKLTCDDTSIKKIVVVQPELLKEQTYAVINHTAYFPIYSHRKIILLEDKRGYRYGNTKKYELQCLMQPEPFIKSALQQAPEQLPYFVNYFSKRSNSQTLSVEELSYLNIYLASREISPDEKQDLRHMVLNYYYETRTSEFLDEYLRTLDVDGLRTRDRARIAELMIGRGLYDEAYKVLVDYGCEQISPGLLVSLCTQIVERQEYQIDDNLLHLCTRVFKQDKYSETILKYLTMYFYGNTKVMTLLWKAARGFEIETMELEERLLVQMLYTTEFPDQGDEIYKSYRGRGKKLVCQAYRSYFSYDYFRKEGSCKPFLMLEIEREYLKGSEVNDCCKLALLKFYSETELQVEQKETARMLYNECMLRKMKFFFYRRLPQEVTADFPIMDKTIIEYRTHPNHRVILHYRILSEEKEQNYIAEDMEHCYEGIFVKEVILYFGETLEYYITEQIGETEQTTKSSQFRLTDVYGDNQKSRFERINEMLFSLSTGDEETLIRQMGDYRKKLMQGKDTFTLL